MTNTLYFVFVALFLSCGNNISITKTIALENRALEQNFGIRDKIIQDSIHSKSDSNVNNTKTLLIERNLCEDFLIMLDSTFVEKAYKGMVETHYICSKSFISKSDSFSCHLTIFWYTREPSEIFYTSSDEQIEMQLKSLSKSNLEGILQSDFYTLEGKRIELYENVGIKNYTASVNVGLPSYSVEMTFIMESNSTLKKPTEQCRSIVNTLEVVNN